MKVDGRLCHDLVTKNMKQKLGYSDEKNYFEWKEQVREKFLELTGLEDIELNAADNNDIEIEEEIQKDGYKQIRFTFESEVGAVVVAYILIPDDIKKEEKRPVVITLQGHSTGAHNSVGIVKYDEDESYQKTRGMFAVQAVKEGYIAVAVEQRGMGERAAKNEEGRRVHLGERGGCYYEQQTGVLLGRTSVGERCFDIKRTIDVLENFKDVCDLEKIVITGNSGGGTTSYYAACYDQRIKISVPSCAFCPYPESILKFYHCSCNYIPHAYKYFDMQDLSCLIAPRRLAMINGKKDPSFLIEGVRRGYETVKKVYEKEGVKENCKSIETEVGHYWCVDIVWPTIKEELAKL
ncbi:MAG: acetylxylan esterase [Clostridia bacterium]|nr:acetylxylan esterase [Clostridia bacterium]